MARKYDSPFLKEVIVRLDFSYPIMKLAKTLPPRLKNIALESFPISEPQEFFGKELLITKEATKEKILSEGTNWLFHNLDRQKTLIIANNNVNISYKKYDSFDVLKQEFLQIVEELLSSYDDLQGKRIGLRYINDIKLSESDVLDWNNYLDERLLNSLTFPQEPSKICRAFNNLELNFGDLIVRFQYGMHNPDYPAPIRKKKFILDYDAYYQGPMNLEDIKQSLDKFHLNIKAIFEQSIKNKLRILMEARNNG